MCKKNKSGGGPPDLSGAGSRDGCPCLKVLQVPERREKKEREEKKCPHECLCSKDLYRQMCVY